MAYPVAQPGVQIKSFMQAEMSGDQTSNLGANDHVEYRTINGQGGSGITLSTGAGQLGGIFTLQAGRTYRLAASNQILYTGSGGTIEYQWYDLTNSAPLGMIGRSLATNAGSSVGDQTTASAVVSPVSDIDVEVRIISVASIDRIRQVSSYAFVEATEAFIPAIDSAKNFSLDEVDTGARWIDGKTIYRKVIDVGGMPNATTISTPHGITTIDHVVKVDGTFTNGSAFRNIVGGNDSASGNLVTIVDGTNVDITATVNFSAFTQGYVIIEYTKV